MKLNSLIDGLEVIKIIGNTDKEISNITYDSRKSSDKSLYVAIKGTKVDGHNFIQELLKNRITAIICEEMPSATNLQDSTIILVDDSRIALSKISDNWYGHPSKSMKVIGVTGTNGKTTITYILKEIFSLAGKKVAVIGTTGIFIGDEKIPATHTTPESLELLSHFKTMKDRGIEVVIMEVSSHALHQSRVASIEFDTALFTNLTHDHLDYHITYQNYAEAKKILFQMLGENGIAISTYDDQFGPFMLDDIQTNQKSTIGRELKNDYLIENENLGLIKSNYILKNQNGDKFYLETPLIGRFNIDNTAIAFLTALKNDIDPEIIKTAISKCSGAPGRMQRVVLRNGAIGIVDYAHTPDALQKALSACKELNIEQKYNSNIICVFGCGGDRDKFKRPVMGKIACNWANSVILTDDNPRTENSESILEDIQQELTDSEKLNVKVIPNRAEAIQYSTKIAKTNDIILIAGKGHEDYQIYGTEKFHFDDAEELKKYS